MFTCRAGPCFSRTFIHLVDVHSLSKHDTGTNDTGVGQQVDNLTKFTSSAFSFLSLLCPFINSELVRRVAKRQAEPQKINIFSLKGNRKSEKTYGGDMSLNLTPSHLIVDESQIGDVLSTYNRRPETRWAPGIELCRKAIS